MSLSDKVQGITTIKSIPVKDVKEAVKELNDFVTHDMFLNAQPRIKVRNRIRKVIIEVFGKELTE